MFWNRAHINEYGGRSHTDQNHNFRRILRPNTGFHVLYPNPILIGKSPNPSKSLLSIYRGLYWKQFALLTVRACFSEHTALLFFANSLKTRKTLFIQGEESMCTRAREQDIDTANVDWIV